MLFGSGITPAGAGAHAYVGDGYAGDSYVHFNFGWNGYHNGFYSIDPFDGFAKLDLECVYGIQPSKNDKPTLPNLPLVGVSSDFYYGNNKINCTVIYRPDLNCQQHTVAIGVILKNTTSGEELFFAQDYKETFPRHDDIVFRSFYGTLSLPFDYDIRDGKYELYPGYQVDGKKWEYCMTSEAYQSVIELTVVDGIKKFINVAPKIDPIAEGHILVDGIYYTFNYPYCEVVAKNNRGNSYQGDIIVPSSVIYNDETYTVNAIGEDAFKNCRNLDEVILPETIETIRTGAFFKCSIKGINLPQLTKLTTIEGWAFNLSFSKIFKTTLPPNIENIGTLAFQGFQWEIVEIPSSLKSISRQAFNTGVNTLIFKSVNLTDVSFYDKPIYKDNTVIFVPKGTASSYNEKFNSKYVNIFEYEDQVVFANGIDIYLNGTKIDDYSDTWADMPTSFIELSRFDKIQFEYKITPSNATVNKISFDYELVSGTTKCDDDGSFFLDSEFPNKETYNNRFMFATIDGTKIAKNIFVKFKPAISQIELYEPPVLQVGETFQIEYAYYPTNAFSHLCWNSSDESVASVDENGLLTAISVGQSTISVKSQDAWGAEGETIVHVGIAGVDVLNIETEETVRIFTPSGIMLFEGKYADAKLSKGIYIIVTQDNQYKQLVR